MIRTTLPYTDVRTESNVIGKNLFEIASLAPKEQDRLFPQMKPGSAQMSLRLVGSDLDPMLVVAIGDVQVACFKQDTLAHAMSHVWDAPSGTNSISPYHTVDITHHAYCTEIAIRELDRTERAVIERGESTGHQGKTLTERMPIGANLLKNWLLREDAPLFGDPEDGVYLIDGLRAVAITPDIRLLAFLSDIDAAFEAHKSVEFLKEFASEEKVYEQLDLESGKREGALNSFFAEP